jgi:hypothetical protein
VIIAFPRARCRISGGRIRGPCTIVILPVVRIERWPAALAKALRELT